MKKSSSAIARIVAVAALAGALILAIVVFSNTLGGDSNDSAAGGHRKGAHHAKQAKRHVPATYTVESGDTLISIAHKNGVTVGQIERLNPEVDPQILIAGETLKLR